MKRQIEDHVRNHGYVWKQEIHDDLCRTLEGNVHIGCLLPHRTRNNKKNQAAIHTPQPTKQTNLFLKKLAECNQSASLFYLPIFLFVC